MAVIKRKIYGHYAIGHRNRYADLGDGTAKLIITNAKGAEHTVLLDASDVDRVQAIGRWNLNTCRDYIEVVHGEGTDRIKLHRFITCVRHDEFVTPINRNYLDMRSCNLAIWPRNKWRTAIRENSTEYLL